uniref:Uncharacterized protein n=1 Tax=Cacopsylla melanoneura TaxID=428564 RepID=A0A8D9E9Q1_9HEMI
MSKSALSNKPSLWDTIQIRDNIILWSEKKRCRFLRIYSKHPLMGLMSQYKTVQTGSESTKCMFFFCYLFLFRERGTPISTQRLTLNGTTFQLILDRGGTILFLLKFYSSLYYYFNM